MILEARSRMASWRMPKSAPTRKWSVLSLSDENQMSMK